MSEKFDIIFEQPPILFSSSASRHVDLEDVFGTKRLKPTQEVKMAHVEALQFTPNVIVQWKVAHAMPRSKIRVRQLFLIISMTCIKVFVSFHCHKYTQGQIRNQIVVAKIPMGHRRFKPPYF